MCSLAPLYVGVCVRVTVKEMLLQIIRQELRHKVRVGGESREQQKDGSLGIQVNS